MLPATQREIEHVTEYMRSEAPELTVRLVQKVYLENVLHVRHDVWDVHTDGDRWWVITEPMNLFKTLLKSAWQFANWLTHTKSSDWHDAEAAIAASENAISLCTDGVNPVVNLRELNLRGVNCRRVNPRELNPRGLNPRQPCFTSHGFTED